MFDGGEVKKVHRDPLLVGLLAGMLVTFGIINAIPELVVVKDLFTVDQAVNIFRLVFSAFAGGLIGYEREYRNRPAGLRTHALVCIGATIVMLIPLEMTVQGGSLLSFDATRLGAQVISGIGFLGAGTIIRNGGSVKGLTTAASLWVAGIIGLAIGAGNYLTSVVGLFTVIFILKDFGNFEHRQGLKYKDRIVNIETKDVPQQIGRINDLIESEDCQLIKMEILEKTKDMAESGKNVIRMRLHVRGPLFLKEKELVDRLVGLSDILDVEVAETRSII